MAFNALVCDPSGLTPLNNEDIQTAGDYLLRKKQLATYKQAQAQQQAQQQQAQQQAQQQQAQQQAQQQQAQQQQAQQQAQQQQAQQQAQQKPQIILTCQNKRVKSTRSYETWTNYAKGQQIVCYECPVAPPKKPLVIVGQISKSSDKDSVQINLWDALTGATKSVMFSPTPNQALGVSAGGDYVLGTSNINEPTIWSSTTSFVLPIPSIAYTASAISSNAQYVVGTSLNKAIIWPSFTAPAQILQGSANYSTAGVTNTGLVIGMNLDNNEPTAWNGLTGALLTLTFVLPATYNDRFVTCISGDGKYVGGYVTKPANLTYGFLWSGLDGSALPVQLQTPPNAADGTITVVGIADDGSLVVGNYTNTLLGNVGGVTWNRITGEVVLTTFEVPAPFDQYVLTGIS